MKKLFSMATLVAGFYSLILYGANLPTQENQGLPSSTWGEPNHYCPNSGESFRPTQQTKWYSDNCPGEAFGPSLGRSTCSSHNRDGGMCGPGGRSTSKESGFF